MPEVAEPPAVETLKTNVGEKFRVELEKARKAELEAPPSEPDKVVELPKEEPKPEPASEPAPGPELKPAAEKPASPLDVLTTEKKEEPEPDVTAEFDDKNPNWKRAREIMREQSGKIKEFQTKLSELEKIPKPQPDEILALSKAKQELEERLQKQEESLKALNYQYSETFQKMVADRDAHVNKIQSRVERLGGDTEKFMAALAMPDGRAKNAAIKEALAEVDSEDRTRIHTLLEGLDEKNEKLLEESKNSSVRWDELQSKRNAELAEENAKQLTQLQKEYVRVSEAIPNEIKTLRMVPDDVEGAAEWNEAIKKADADALRVLTPNGADFDESVKIAKMGAHYPYLSNLVLKQNAQIKEMAKRLAEYDSGGADFKGGKKPATEVKLDPAQRYHKALEQIKSSPTE